MKFYKKLKRAIDMHRDIVKLKDFAVLTPEDSHNLDEHLRAELLRCAQGLSTKSGTVIPDTKFKVPRKP